VIWPYFLLFENSATNLRQARRKVDYSRPNLSQCPRAALALSCPMDNERLFLAIVIVGGLLPIAVIVLFLLL
jgi:hypothetical protein